MPGAKGKGAERQRRRREKRRRGRGWMRKQNAIGTKTGKSGSMNMPLVFAIGGLRSGPANLVPSRTPDSCLVLTGPTRPIVMLGPSTFEIVLKVKGSTESGDKDLSFLAIPHANVTSLELSCLINRKYTSKLSTLEFTMSQIVCSVEATISVQVVDGSWPDGFRGEFTACTTSMADKKVILLNSGSEKVPVNADGMVQLSRCVASVELAGELKVSVEAWQGEDVETKPKKAGKVFKPKKANRNYGTFNLGFCKMKVTVAWSLLSYYPVNHLGSLNGLPSLL